MFNPAKQNEALNSPVERASDINDPSFENEQGYFAYDLTHQEFISPLFGQITPSMHLVTTPGDRTVVRNNSSLILNQINGNLLSTLNQYNDTFYVPLRNVFPNNYEKLIPNPVKGDDLPYSALPQVPFMAYLRDLYRCDEEYRIRYDDEDNHVNLYVSIERILEEDFTSVDDLASYEFSYLIGRLNLLSTILSRGQLLDYLGIQFDSSTTSVTKFSNLQSAIDKFYSALYLYFIYNRDDDNIANRVIYSVPIPLTSDHIDLESNNVVSYECPDLSRFRSAISDILETGKFVWINPNIDVEDSFDLMDSIKNLIRNLDDIFITYTVDREYFHISTLDNSTSNPFEDGSTLNIGSILAYQQIVAHYYSNDHIDNVYTSELFMQNLRSVMFPSDIEESFITHEPIFDMNGVTYEYDYISYGSFWTSLLSIEFAGWQSRQYVYATLMFLLRRSLRYGDYFSTARPRMLAVSDQLGISVDDGMVSPIDVTKNLLMQRYLNAANYIGQGFLQYMSSIYGIKPSDTGCTPRFISHRKIELQNQITNNTANNQGAQTTNIVGYADDSAFDVFIDDFGYILSLTSFDVLPVYKSGIDNTYHFADRFDYFNPMLQGIGDQPIRNSEIFGKPQLYDDVFGYTMRNAEYKFKVSKAHGAFCNSLPGFMLSYPLSLYSDSYGVVKISPDFIRDKPAYLDPLVERMTGISPGEYFHFIISCTNQVNCARKIQATPGILF